MSHDGIPWLALRVTDTVGRADNGERVRIVEALDENGVLIGRLPVTSVEYEMHATRAHTRQLIGDSIAAGTGPKDIAHMKVGLRVQTAHLLGGEDVVVSADQVDELAADRELWPRLEFTTGGAYQVGRSTLVPFQMATWAVRATWEDGSMKVRVLERGLLQRPRGHPERDVEFRRALRARFEEQESAVEYDGQLGPPLKEAGS